MGALPGCARLGTPGGQFACESPTATAAIVDRLYLGRVRQTGGEVSDVEMENFLQLEVTPRFPQGLTILAARGQWRLADGRIVAERTTVLELTHPASAADRARVAEIAAAYKHLFQQEAVLWQSQSLCTTF